MTTLSDSIALLQRLYAAQDDEKLMVAAVLDNRLKRKAMEDGVVFKCIKRAKTTESGGTKLKRLIGLLQLFTIDEQHRNQHQIQLHRGMIGSVLGCIFKHDSEAALKVAMQTWNLPSNNQLYAAIAPRRIGKTQAVAMFVAAFAIAVPGTVTSIFSTAKRASGELLDIIKMFIETVVDCGFKIEECNKERMVLRSGKLRTKISSYPGRADTYVDSVVYLISKSHLDRTALPLCCGVCRPRRRRGGRPLRP